MKPSRYTLFVEAKNDQWFIYNALTGTVLVVDAELKQCLHENHLEKIDPPFLDSLNQYGFITDESIDELKIHRFNHNLAKYNKRKSSFLVFTTYGCNLCCPYCYEGPVVSPEYSSLHMRPEMTSQVAQFIINQTLHNKSQTVGIGLYGGEPLLNMDCCETLLKTVSQWCTTSGVTFYATVTTNGTLLTEAGYARIGKYLSSVHITLDGPQHFHDKNRTKKDGSGSYADILHNLSLLRTTKEHLSIRINVDEENRHAMGEVLRDLEKIGFKGRPYFHLYFAQIMPQDACLTFPEDPEYETQTKESIWYLPPLMKMALDRGWGTHLAVNIGQEHCLVPTNVTSCAYVKDGMYSIDPQGDIYMCPASAGSTQYRIGKICNGAATWEPSYYHIITRDPTLIEPCTACDVLPACGGGCAIASYFKYADYHTTFCKFTRDIIYERLRAHLKFRYPERIDE
jgi:uncharacterized protein